MPLATCSTSSRPKRESSHFDATLRATDPRRGIRDVEAVDALARAAGLVPIDDRAMPANNRLRVWRRHLVQPSPAAGPRGRPIQSSGDLT